MTHDYSMPPDQIWTRTWGAVCLHGRIGIRSLGDRAQSHALSGVHPEPRPPSRAPHHTETHRHTTSTVLQSP